MLRECRSPCVGAVTIRQLGVIPSDRSWTHPCEGLRERKAIEVISFCFNTIAVNYRTCLRLKFIRALQVFRYVSYCVVWLICVGGMEVMNSRQWPFSGEYFLYERPHICFKYSFEVVSSNKRI